MRFFWFKYFAFGNRIFLYGLNWVLFGLVFLWEELGFWFYWRFCGLVCISVLCREIWGKSHKMHKDKIFKLAKGFRGRAKNCIRIARERVEKALQYSYRDRRTKKRDMRALWIQRINAGTRIHGVSFELQLLWFIWWGFRELYTVRTFYCDCFVACGIVVLI